MVLLETLLGALGETMALLLITEITRNKNSRQNYTERTPSACGLFFRSFKIFVLMKTPLIAGIVEIQHEAITSAWSGKRLEVQASPSNCPKTAKIISDKDFF